MLCSHPFGSHGMQTRTLEKSTKQTKKQATVDFEAQDEAVLAKILVPAGTPDVAVGTPMMVLIEDAGDVAAFKDFSAGEAAPAAAPAEEVEAVAPASSEPAPAPAAAAVAPPAAASGARVAASPLAKLVSARWCCWCVRGGEGEGEGEPSGCLWPLWWQVLFL